MAATEDLRGDLAAAGNSVEVHVCHTGASRTGLIRETTGTVTRLLTIMLSPLAQSAERGSWPEVMCAREAGLAPAAYSGPTRFEMVGPVGAYPLKAFVLDAQQAEGLWDISEEKTGVRWPF